MLAIALDSFYKKGGDKALPMKFSVTDFSGEYWNIEVEMREDLLSGKKRCLIVHRIGGGAVDIDIFSIGDSLQKLVSHSESEMTFENDTIRDINGDGRKDFVVNWYGTNGCCLKAYADVYLMRPDGISFSKPINFLNPTFFPEEQLIRGVCYGQPGMTPLYKKKWKGEAVEDVEYVFFEMDTAYVKTGKIVRADAPSVAEAKRLEYLDEIPKEYEGIFGFDWFLDKLE